MQNNGISKLRVMRRTIQLGVVWWTAFIAVSQVGLMTSNDSVVQLFPQNLSHTISVGILETTYHENIENLNRLSMCNNHGIGYRSAMSIWVSNADSILSASRLHGVRKNINHDITVQVFRMVTPRLAMSQRSYSRDFRSTHRVLMAAHKRYMWLKNKSRTETSTVRIVVLGGSVTMGIGCHPGIRFWDVGKCSWPSRVQSIINTLAGGELVSVHNLAIGGTNTRQGRAIVQYEMLPVAARNPHILINAYSTNDMHILTMKEADSGNITLRQAIYNMAQDFVRSALDPCQDEQPLLLWLDDYLGNEQRGILHTTALSQSIQVLSNYYGFGFLSYADVVRDWVYSDTHEAIFSPGGWYKGPGRMRREIHPGHCMHMTVAWIVVYNFLHMASTHCSLEPFEALTYKEKVLSNTSTVPGFPMLKTTLSNNTLLFNTAQHPRAFGLPPPLAPGLMPDDVSVRWRSSNENKTTCTPEPDDLSYAPKCPFSWISGLTTDNNLKTTTGIHNIFEGVIAKPTNWELHDDTGQMTKFGWMPPANSTHDKVMTMEFNTEKPSSNIALFFLKSYGPKWESSSVEIVFEVKSVIVLKQIINGFHDKKTSEMCMEEVHLPVPASDLRVRLTLRNGKTFKLLGIAVCR